MKELNDAAYPCLAKEYNKMEELVFFLTVCKYVYQIHVRPNWN